MDASLRKEMRDYAWGYFALHADQRIKTFNFFVVLSAFMVGGMVALLKETGNPRFAVPVAFGLAFISLVFWRLDVRNRELIYNSEGALRELEEDDRLPDQAGKPNRAKVFTHEKHATDLRKKTRYLRCIPAHYSFSMCFGAVFAVFGLGGLIAGMIFLVSPKDLLPNRSDSPKVTVQCHCSSPAEISPERRMPPKTSKTSRTGSSRRP